MGINNLEPFQRILTNKLLLRIQYKLIKLVKFLILIAILLNLMVGKEISASGLFFPGKFNPALKAKLATCDNPPLAPFRFELADFEEKNIINLTKKLRARSILEGEARGKSITCIRNLILTDAEFNQMDGALNSMFRVESQLLFTYGRWLESQSGLDLTEVRKFLQSRYQLNNLIQSSTREKIIAVTTEEQAVINADFATLYHSVLRTYFEYIYNLDDYSRNRYFQAKKGQ